MCFQNGFGKKVRGKEGEQNACIFYAKYIFLVSERDVHVKMNFIGNGSEEIEQMIVDDNESNIQETLHEEGSILLSILHYS